MSLLKKYSWGLNSASIHLIFEEHVTVLIPFERTSLASHSVENNFELNQEYFFHFYWLERSVNVTVVEPLRSRSYFNA